MLNKPLDGKPVTGAISGFKSYSTERTEVPERPVPVLSPGELLIQLRALQAVINDESTTQMITDLQKHIQDTNNPHHTNLSAFTEDVADILYQEYLSQGGTGSREFYLNCLFQTLRIASLDEMQNGTDENLLVSIRGAADFIRNHEQDENAHADLFEEIFPGDAPTYDPAFACYASVGMSNYFIKKLVGGEIYDPSQDTSSTSEDTTVEESSQDICSFVGPDRRVSFCSYRDYNGIDYTPGTATYACFGRRTNEIVHSENISDLNLINLTSEVVSGVTTPSNETTGANAVTTLRDTGPALHTIYIKDVVLDYTDEKTFSVYAKAVNCRYLAITWKDMTGSDIEVKAIYDLEQGQYVIINSLERYRANIVELTDGWYRCEFTMCHPIGQITDLNMIFFKEKDTDWSMTFQGDQELCGYLWGLQLEGGPCASPYIRTLGSARTREAISYVIPLDETWWESTANTIHVDWVNGKTQYLESTTRPIFTVVNDATEPAIRVRNLANGKIELLRYANTDIEGYGRLASVIYQDIFEYDNRKWLQLTHGIDNTQIVSLFNEAPGLNLNTPTQWESGTQLYLGCDTDGNCFDGYIRSVVIYPRRATVEEAKFMNGEEIHG